MTALGCIELLSLSGTEEPGCIPQRAREQLDATKTSQLPPTLTLFLSHPAAPPKPSQHQLWMDLAQLMQVRHKKYTYIDTY